MLPPRWKHRACWLLLPAVTLMQFPGPAAAQDADALRTETSLAFIPADAAMYVSALRNREQFEAFVGSRAFARLQEMPLVQMALEQMHGMFGGGMQMGEEAFQPQAEDDPFGEDRPEDDAGDEADEAQDQDDAFEDDEEGAGEEEVFEVGPPAAGGAEIMQAFLSDPANLELLALAADAASHEMFMYGDPRTGAFLQLMLELQTVTAATPVAVPPVAAPEDEAEDAFDPTAASQQQTRQMMKALSDYLQQHPSLPIPGLLIGFKLSDPQPATAQLARLEELLQQHLAEAPPELQGSLTREEIDGTEYLVWRASGEMIPFWSDLTPEDTGLPAAEHTALVEKLEQVKLVISLGIRQDYLLLALGETNDMLGTLGQGELLVDAPELAMVARHATERLTSISYVSQQFMEQAANSSQQMNQMFNTIEQAVPLMDDLDETLREELLADVKLLVQELQGLIPAPAAAAGCSFMTPRGYESYAYNWGRNPVLDATQPLTILNHVGGAPLLFSAARVAGSDAGYDFWARWIGRGFYYGREIGLDQVDDPQQRAMAETVLQELEAIGDELDANMRTRILPALQDGQSALVIDGQLTDTQWFAGLPPADRPLPIPEVGMVLGVSDPELLKEGAAEGARLVQKFFDQLHAANPMQYPEIQLPAVRSRDFPSGTVYFYLLPVEAGLDKRVSPNAGLGADVAALSIVPLYTKRLLDSTPAAIDGPVADRFSQPLGAAAHWNIAGTIDALSPWIDYGIDLSSLFFESFSGMGGGENEFDVIIDEEGQGFDDEAGNDEAGDDEAGDDEAGETPDDEEPSADDVDDTEDFEDGLEDGQEFGPEGFDAEEDDFGPPGGAGIGSMIPPPAEMKAAVHAFLDVLKCIRGYASATYAEDDVLVTHAEWHIQDLPE